MVRTSLLRQKIGQIRFGNLPRATRSGNRGSVFIWLLPAVAIVGLATYLWVMPGARRPIAAGENVNGKDVKSDESSTSELPATEIASANESNAEEVKEVASVGKIVSVDTPGAVEKQLEGEWEGFYQGKRRMSVRADGTCTMIAEPEGIAATLLAPKLTFDIRWKVNGEHMEFETVGGEPLNKVNIVLRMYGKQRSHKILKIEANNLVLLDEDGVTEYEWRRVK